MFVATQAFDIAGAIENRQNPVPKLVNPRKESCGKIERQISRKTKGGFHRKFEAEKPRESRRRCLRKKPFFD